MDQPTTVSIPIEYLRQVHVVETVNDCDFSSDDDAISLRDLVAAVAEFSDSEREVVATVTHMLRSGRVSLSGRYEELPMTKLCG